MDENKPSTEINDVAPTSIRHMIGQKGVMAQVAVALDAAFADAKKFDHALLVGGPGLGKSQTARIIAAEVATELHKVLGQSITCAADLNTLLLSAKDKDVVHVDEAHELDREFQTALYLATDQRRIVLQGKSKAGPQSIPLAWCERQGQVEVGIIEHEGHTFAALGASVQGRHVTGYTNLTNGDIFLSTWCGKTMLACRWEAVEEYHDGSMVLLFRLTKGRYIVGYALGEKRMLFRGELVTDCTDDEARRTASQIADHFAELDAQDEFEFNASQSEEEPLLDIEYRCPECGHEWEEQWESACDSECPNCGTKNITALSWEEHQG